MAISNSALADELEALNSIYDSKALAVSDSGERSGTSAILTLPDVPFSFLLHFPPTYPDAPPAVKGTHHVEADVKKGTGEAAVGIVHDVLGRVYVPGQVCIFDLVEEASPLLARTHPTLHETAAALATTDGDRTLDGSLDTSTESSDETDQIRSDVLASGRSTGSPGKTTTSTTELTDDHFLSTTADSSCGPDLEPQWALSEKLVVNKSIFIARSLAVSSLSEATDAISHLLATNKKVASATHNITAWRIKQRAQPRDKHQSPMQGHVQGRYENGGRGKGGEHDGPEVVIQDCDDDGETAAGGRLLHLMQLMDVWNCCVVVTRWYGGVKLGPDRFRCINAVAREALLNGGFVPDDRTGNNHPGQGQGQGKSGGGGGKGKKR